MLYMNKLALKLLCIYFVGWTGMLSIKWRLLTYWSNFY